MALVTIKDLLLEQLKDIYSAENQLIKALPKAAKAATAPQLKSAIKSHLAETQEHAARLEKAGKLLGEPLKGKVCKAMKGLIEEAKEAMEEDAGAPMIDALIIAAAQRIEHYEISAYGTARTFAEAIGAEEIAALLQKTEDEEKACDKELTEICISRILSDIPRDAKSKSPVVVRRKAGRAGAQTRNR